MFKILYQRFVDVYFSITKLNDPIDNESTKDKLFVYRSTASSNKQLNLKYPYIVTLTLEMTVSKTSTMPGMLTYSYWFFDMTTGDTN